MALEGSMDHWKMSERGNCIFNVLSIAIPILVYIVLYVLVLFNATNNIGVIICSIVIGSIAIIFIIATSILAIKLSSLINRISKHVDVQYYHKSLLVISLLIIYNFLALFAEIPALFLSGSKEVFVVMVFVFRYVLTLAYVIYPTFLQMRLTYKTR